jgi:hypothetical protein
MRAQVAAEPAQVAGAGRRAGDSGVMSFRGHDGLAPTIIRAEYFADRPVTGDKPRWKHSIFEQ